MCFSLANRVDCEASCWCVYLFLLLSAEGGDDKDIQEKIQAMMDVSKVSAWIKFQFDRGLIWIQCVLV